MAAGVVPNGVASADASVEVAPDVVRQYLNEIGRVTLLTAESEVDLAKRINAGIAAERLLDAPDALSPHQRARLRMIEARGDEAHRILVESNLRLVVSVAKRYVNRGLPLADLIQEGNLGLIRAVEKFDHRRGYKFSTYATWWIRQMIGRAVADQSRTIRIPVHLFEAMQRVRRTERALAQRLGREPTTEDVAREAGVEAARVEEFRRLAVTPASLDAPVSVNADGTVGDVIEDRDAVVPIDVVAQHLLHEHLDVVLGRLHHRERVVLVRRFGLDGNGPRTLEQVGAELDLTRERIRQIEVRALSKLRRPGIAETLEDYLTA